MFFVGTDFIESGGTFSANIKSDGAGRILAKVYATSGMLIKSPYMVGPCYATSGTYFTPLMGSGATATGAQGLMGIASGVIASGCVGWVTIRGPVDDASSSATVQFTGSIGHAVFFSEASGLGASSSAYHGLAHQVGFLLEEATATYAVNIFLSGNTHVIGM